MLDFRYLSSAVLSSPIGAVSHEIQRILGASPVNEWPSDAWVHLIPQSQDLPPWILIPAYDVYEVPGDRHGYKIIVVCYQ